MHLETRSVCGPTRDPAGPMGGMQGCVVAGLGKQECTSTPEHNYSCYTHQFLEKLLLHIHVDMQIKVESLL